MKIIHEPTQAEPYIIVDKPQGLASAPLKADEDSVITRIVKMYPQVLDVKGKKEIEYGLVHRLDTATGGILLIAATQNFYDEMIQKQSEGNFIKEYTAVCDFIGDITQYKDGFQKCPYIIEWNKDNKAFIEVESTFRPFGPGRKEVRPVISGSTGAAGKKSGSLIYKTKIQLEKISDTKVKAVCKISRGYRHQVRCHLAWLGFSVEGDKLYNPRCGEGAMQFFATGLLF